MVITNSKQDKIVLICIQRHRRTSGACAGVQRQAAGSSPQDLLLRLWPLLLLITLLFSLGEAKLERREQHSFFFNKMLFTAAGDYTEADRAGLFWRNGLVVYLFGRVGRLGEDGLPVRPHKHDEREVEEDQVDAWRGGETEHQDQQHTH